MQPQTRTLAEEDAAWPTQGKARRISLRPLTALLSVLLIATLAVYAGARLDQRERGGGATAAPTGGFPTGARTGGFGAGATGAAAGTTSGTVTQVGAKLLYLTSSTGALVKVELTRTTTFTRTAASPKGGLALGDTAIVRGARNARGVLVATAVIATAKGVTSSFGGGFGGAPTGG